MSQYRAVLSVASFSHQVSLLCGAADRLLILILFRDTKHGISVVTTAAVPCFGKTSRLHTVFSSRVEL